MKCLNCGQENNNENIYCASCGKKLPRLEKVCDNCNTINSSDSIYCKKCGNELDDVKIITENKKSSGKSLMIYKLLSILSVCINFVSSSLLTFNMVGLSLGSVCLKICKKLDDDKEKRTIKICSIFGIVISSLFILIKLIIVIVLIISFLETGQVPESPDYSYFF